MVQPAPAAVGAVCLDGTRYDVYGISLRPGDEPNMNEPGFMNPGRTKHFCWVICAGWGLIEHHSFPLRKPMNAMSLGVSILVLLIASGTKSR